MDDKLSVDSAQVQAILTPFSLMIASGSSTAGSIPLELVPIPGGIFWMGQSAAETQKIQKEIGEVDFKKWHLRELPQHQVKISPFWMSKYPITQAQYEAVMGENPTQGKAWCLKDQEWRPDLPVPEIFVGSHKPVVAVSWEMAREFCNTLAQHLSQQLSQRLFPQFCPPQVEQWGTYAISLPTEAEWEYACRAGTATPFYFGSHLTSAQANIADCDNLESSHPQAQPIRQVTTPVGQFPANTWGLYDMHGNVWEWCSDQFYPSYLTKPHKLTQDGSIAWTEENTFMTPAVNFRILRGGSWDSPPRSCRSAFRNRSNPFTQHSNYGFRIVCRMLGFPT